MRIFLTDNLFNPKNWTEVVKKEGDESLVYSDVDRDRLLKIAGKSLKSLSSGEYGRGRFLIYPSREAEFDLDDKDSIFELIDPTTDNPGFRTGNVMGFIGFGDNLHMQITSRFESGDKNYFLHYMLQKVCHVGIATETQASEDQLHDFLYYLFPGYLNAALEQGLYRAYVTREYNDSNIRGPIDVARHIRYNIPFNGKVAYHTREYTADNAVMQLVRHTIEYIRSLSFGSSILSGDEMGETRDNVLAVETATESYERGRRQKVIALNLHPVTHPYYTAYEPLRKLCLAILRHEKVGYDNAEEEINGILFDGASLWEDYLNIVMREKFGEKLLHPNNRTKENVQHFFKNEKGHLKCPIIPDYLFCNKGFDGDEVLMADAVLDAKYRRLEHGISDVSQQILSYMFRFGSKKGFFLYPVKCPVDAKKKEGGESFSLIAENSNITVTTVPFYVPDSDNVESFENYCDLMEKAEKDFLTKLNIS